MTLVVVLHEQLEAGADVRAAGLTLVRWAAGLGLASWFAGSFLVPRFGNHLMPAGVVVLATGLFTAGATADPRVFLGARAVTGIGAGLFSPPFFTAALHAVGPAVTGSAAGLLNAVQQLGATLGVALLGGVYFAGGAPAAYRVAVVLVAGTIQSVAVLSGRVRWFRRRRAGSGRPGSPVRSSRSAPPRGPRR